MKAKLYHREVFWKSNFDTKAKKLLDGNIILSEHIWEHIEDNSNPKYAYDFDTLCECVESIVGMDTIKPYEVEVENNLYVSKFCIRIPYDHRDISLVFRKGLLVTAWLNNRDDLHSTLDVNKYERR